ncbi:MAG TPA: hemerythrin domain-containing protein [Methylomirabilota bacterium]|nr:hemerythrin domain-containing protein [Methylomirabilota bacterium]
MPACGGPIDVMLEEHAEGRALVAAMAEGRAAARAATARRYVRLLREHIAKENEILFPLADAVLDDAAQAVLLREFAQADAELGAA